jgi:putative FmdB family regulatory protein
MPTYDYHCETCGQDFEHFQSMSAPKLTRCLEESCIGTTKGQGVVIRKISGGAGLVFNGDGFYVTDYVKKDSASSSKSSGKTEEKSEGKSDAKSGAETSSGSAPSSSASKEASSLNSASTSSTSASSTSASSTSASSESKT